MVSAASLCAWAMAPASGVRSSCAALAAKLRSASKAETRRARSSFSVAATGRISAGRPSAGKDEVARAPGPEPLAEAPERGRGDRGHDGQQRQRITTTTGSPRPIWISRATAAR